MKKKMTYKCVNCDATVDELYKIYSPTVSKLTTCEKCLQITDKYIEYEPVIIMIDLILLRKEAFRHFLYNTEFQIFWKLSILLQLMEAYSEWMFNFSKLKDNSKNDHNHTLDDLIFKQSDIDFYIFCIKVIYRNTVYVLAVYIVTKFLRKLDVVKCEIDIISIIKLFTISSFGKFFLLPALIWSNYTSQFLNIHLVLIYTTLCQFLVYSVVGQCSMIWSIIVVVNANILRLVSTDLVKSMITSFIR